MRWKQSAPPQPVIPLRRILVVPLLTKNPTSAGDQGEAPHDGVVVETPALGVMTRSRSRRIAALTPSLPEEILVWEIFVRLPAKDLLRCGVVCRAWRSLTSAADFLLAHHRRQPSLPLLTLYGSAGEEDLDNEEDSDSEEDGLPIEEDSDSEEDGPPIFNRSRPVLGFDDYDPFEIHASGDGLLLLSLFGPRFIICNPATRQCARIPCLDAHGIEIAALYLHCPSTEYRVLYWKDRGRNHQEAAYYILTVQTGSSPRRIGVPSDIPGSEKVTLTFRDWRTTTFAPPILLHRCLHWDPGCFSSNADIVVFDTVVESFRFMRGPAGATRFCTRLCDMEGSMSFSCFDEEMTIVKIWVLEDYAREVWSFKYHVKLPVESLCSLEDTHLVLSHNGDVLVYSPSKDYMFHCDNNGKLLEKFRCDDMWSLSIIGHWFKESLVEHNFFSRRGIRYAGEPDLFHRL